MISVGLACSKFPENKTQQQQQHTLDHQCKCPQGLQSVISLSAKTVSISLLLGSHDGCRMGRAQGMFSRSKPKGQAGNHGHHQRTAYYAEREAGQTAEADGIRGGG